MEVENAPGAAMTKKATTATMAALAAAERSSADSRVSAAESSKEKAGYGHRDDSSKKKMPRSTETLRSIKDEKKKFSDR